MGGTYWDFVKFVFEPSSDGFSLFQTTDGTDASAFECTPAPKAHEGTFCGCWIFTFTHISSHNDVGYMVKLQRNHYDYLGYAVWWPLSKINFAQWRYSDQWSNREVLLLLVENYTQYPALTGLTPGLRQFLQASVEAESKWNHTWARLHPEHDETHTYIIHI